ncbi:hypothetical protein HOY82DRAFT_581340 [Tuber indicum]|nr:hypothetical protein HOY82DRAFT_581340 [Tuber indicum]
MRQHSKLHLPLPKPPSEVHEPRQGSDENKKKKKKRGFKTLQLARHRRSRRPHMSRPRAQGPIFHPITQQRPTYITPVIEGREGGEDG